MFIRTAIAVVAAALIIKAGTAFAQVPAAPPAAPPAAGAPVEGHRHAGFARLLQGLNLTPAQTAKIEAIRAKYRQQNQDVTDPTQRHANMKAQRDEIMAVLTPQQQQQLQQKIAAMRERWKNREGGSGVPTPSATR